MRFNGSFFNENRQWVVDCNKIVKFGWDKINTHITGGSVQNRPNNGWFSEKKPNFNVYEKVVL